MLQTMLSAWQKIKESHCLGHSEHMSQCVRGYHLLLFVLQHLSDAQLCTPADLACWLCKQEEAKGHAAICGHLSVKHVGDAKHKMYQQHDGACLRTTVKSFEELP